MDEDNFLQRIEQLDDMSANNQFDFRRSLYKIIKSDESLNQTLHIVINTPKNKTLEKI